MLTGSRTLVFPRKYLPRRVVKSARACYSGSTSFHEPVGFIFKFGKLALNEPLAVLVSGFFYAQKYPRRWGLEEISEFF